MGFKADFTDADVKRYLEQQKQAFERSLIDRLMIIGEQFITDARSELSKWKYIEVSNKKGDGKGSGQQVFYRNGKKYTRSSGGGDSFSDWTNNLRSSIGFGIHKDRVFIAGNFLGGKGGTAAKDKAQSVALMEGISISFVAGMDYAKAVEAKGYEVITGSAKDALKALRRSLKQLAKKGVVR